METERLMDIHEVAACLNVSPGTLYHWQSERRGPPCVRLSSRCIRWRRSDVNAWVSERVEKPGQGERRKGRKAAATLRSGEEERVAGRENDIEKESAVLEAEITGGATDNVVHLDEPKEE